MARPAKPNFALQSRASSRRKEPAPLPETISSWSDFYRVIRRIPRGHVCTYGAVAAMAGHPRSARHVGFALSALKDSKPGRNGDIPWQRVVGARPRNRAAVTIKDPVGGALQRMLLESEGVVFDARGNISLDRFGWFQKSPAARPAKKSAARVLPPKRRSSGAGS